jgi:N-acetylneuraminate synthase
MSEKIVINGREIGPDFKPFVIPEIGINHEGDFQKAKKMIEDAKQSGAECVKFQCHVIEDEMIENNVIPANANESIWEIMKRCAFTKEQEIQLKEYTEKLGLIYLSTPFSREAADRLEEMNVCAYKIGSGECNNYPLVKHIANFGKPIILSTGMNNLEGIEKSTNILKNAGVEFAILHVTSIYPTPHENVRLGMIKKIKERFPNVVLGLSDHSFGNYTCYAAIPLGASILEKHFTSDKNWPGPDIPVSIDPSDLKQLIDGSDAIHKSLDGDKEILRDEEKTSNFAFSCVVSIKDIKKGENFSSENIWVKRPGNGDIKAEFYDEIMNKKAIKDVKKNTQLKWDMID